jgi:hypothetical protein
VSGTTEHLNSPQARGAALEGRTRMEAGRAGPAGGPQARGAALKGRSVPGEAVAALALEEQRASGLGGAGEALPGTVVEGTKEHMAGAEPTGKLEKPLERGQNLGKDKEGGPEDGRTGPQSAKVGCWGVGEQLCEGDRRFVAAVVEKNRDVFAFSLEEIGQFKLFEVELKLKSERPIFERRRKHSLREWELVDERCRELEAAGIIEACDSDFAANSVMAAKKDRPGRQLEVGAVLH